MNKESLLKNILGEARKKIQEELGGLLGHPLTLEKPLSRVVSKQDFFAEAPRKLVLTKVSIDGDLDGEMFLAMSTRDAILLGGTLIMLPPSELDERVKQEVFGEDENDAFGEIANIITGVINALFEEYSSKKLRFKKTTLLPVAVNKIDPEATDPFPPQSFLRGSFSLKLEEQALGDLDILFPEWLYATAAEPPAVSLPAEPPLSPESRNDLPKVLIFSEHGADSRELTAALREEALEPVCMNLQDDARELLRAQEVRGIFLVVKEVTEQAFAVAIRIHSAAPEHVPIIAAGPQWTRTTVLKAVKFGIRDILVTPATPEEIREKVDSCLKAKK